MKHHVIPMLWRPKGKLKMRRLGYKKPVLQTCVRCQEITNHPDLG